MKEVFLLTKILFKSAINSKSEKKPKENKLIKYIGWTFLYLYIAGVIGFLSYEIVSALKEINQEAVFLNLCLIAILGINITRSLFTSINLLFFSKDIEFLLPLPVKSYKIIMAKINCMLISEYMIGFFVFIPCLLVYGYLLNLNIFFYIMGILVMLLIPVIPIMLVSLIMTIVMRFTNVIRNKDFVQYISVFLTLLLIFGIQFLTGAESQITTEEMANMLVKANGLVENYTKVFFSLKPAMNALLNFQTMDGITNLAILLIQTFVIYAIVIWIMSKFYIKTVTNTTSSSLVNNKLKENEDKYFTQKSVAKAYIKKEFQNLIRNPIFLMQCVLPSILFPFLFSIPIYVAIQNGEMGGIEELKNTIINGMALPSGVAISIAILMFFYMFNYIAVTSVSRDGENAVFMKYIPISLEKQCWYKILPGIIMNFVPTLYFTIVMKFLFQNSISNQILIWINAIALLFNILNNYLMIIIDLKNPKLHWTTEYAVVKQNFNMFWEILICFAEIGLIVAWGFFVQSVEIFSIVVIVVLALWIRKTQKNISKNSNELFEKIA